MRLCLSFLFLVYAFTATAQDRVSLIIKYGAGTKTAIRFDFNNGRFVSKRTLFKSDEDKNGWIDGIVGGRYLVTSNRTVYDHRPKDEITFDLELNRIVPNSRRPKTNGENFPDRFRRSYSPDRKSYVVTDNPFYEQLVVHREGEADLVIGGPFRATVAERSSFTPFLPFYWLDDRRMLTQRVNGSLVIVTTDGIVENFAEIPCSADDFPQLYKTRVGRIIYSCGKAFALDIERRTFRQIRDDLDFWFSFEYVDGEAVFFFNDEEIGRGGGDASTTQNYIALTDAATSGRLIGKTRFIDSSAVDRVKVWNTFTRKWIQFKLGDGWAEVVAWYQY